VTEVEWRDCSDARVLTNWLARKGPGGRKHRQFALACLTRVEDRLPDDVCRTALAVSRRFVLGRAGLPELEAARESVEAAAETFTGAAALAAHAVACVCDLGNGADLMLDVPMGVAALLDVPEQESELWRQCELVRCVFGNPFRPSPFEPRWRTADVTGMARGIYEERAFDRLPILADALMDAGCDDAAILGHCRGPGPHVRGCWVVDLVLGEGVSATGRCGKILAEESITCPYLRYRLRRPAGLPRHDRPRSATLLPNSTKCGRPGGSSTASPC
jgi:hypothetical protein